MIEVFGHADWKTSQTCFRLVMSTEWEVYVDFGVIMYNSFCT